MTPMQWPTSAQQLYLLRFEKEKHMYKKVSSLAFIAVPYNNFLISSLMFLSL